MKKQTKIEFVKENKEYIEKVFFKINQFIDKNEEIHLRSDEESFRMEIINFLYDNIDFKLKISGHTDSQGSQALNLQLSKDRAENIRDYIVIFAGILERRVEWEGLGSSVPLVEENTEADKKINRRVEFQIYREGALEK